MMDVEIFTVNTQVYTTDLTFPARSLTALENNQVPIGHFSLSACFFFCLLMTNSIQRFRYDTEHHRSVCGAVLIGMIGLG